MRYYAQINADGIAVAVTQTAAEVNDPSMIEADGLDDELLGKKWDGADWVALPPAPVALPRHLSVGAFKDRLGMDALAIAVSSHPVCVAVREMLYDRKLVDLDRPDAQAFLGMLMTTGQPEANPLFPGSGPMTEAKISAILGAPIQDRERP